VLTGWTRGPGDDLCLIKTDSDGIVEWSRSYGGDDFDMGQSVQQTGNGGYIVTGWTRSLGAGGENVYLIRTDGEGNEVWSRTFGGPGEERGHSVLETRDGGFAVVGYTLSLDRTSMRVCLIKTDPSGEETWSRTHETMAEGQWIGETLDGGFVVTGYIIEQEEPAPGGAQELYVLKTDVDGNKIWSLSLGGESTDKGYSVQQTTDGGYIVAGCTHSLGLGTWEYSDIYLIKIAPDVPPAPFRRGDSDSSGALNLTDAVYTLNHLFLGALPPSCADAADADDNGRLNLSDAVYTLNHLFLGGPGPHAPFQDCGFDPSDDDLSCAAYPKCEG
jgi:hypothetical protein